MGLRLALDAILRLIASWRHELCNLVHTGFDYFRTGPVVDDLADFELVIAHLVAASREPAGLHPHAHRGSIAESMRLSGATRGP